MNSQVRTQKSELRMKAIMIAFCALSSAFCAELLLADMDTGHTAAPSANAPAPAIKSEKDGELSAESKGVNKQKMTISKLDPPAAFNLEDIQNFPEDRLLPVLNNPVTFEEGRDFSNMMDSQDDKMIHPWLPEIAQAPFLTMKTVLDKPAKDWTFSIIDQGGSPVASQDGKGTPPAFFPWNGDDKERGHVAVDTVYIPQLATTDRDGYRHTYSGQPMQYATILLKEKGRTIVEMSSKRIFLEKKSDLSKEAPVFLDKVCDLIREEVKLPFALRAYDVDSDLARARTDVLVKYFSEKLFIPTSQITVLEPGSSEKRGLAIAVTLNGTPGSAD